MTESEIGLKDVPEIERYNSGVKSHIIFIPIIILIFSVYIIFLSSVISPTHDLIPLIPGSGIIDIIIVLIFLPLISVLLIFFTPKIAMGYFKIYRGIFGKSRFYYLDMKVQLGKLRAFDIIKRTITPGLLICAFSQILIESTGIHYWTTGTETNYMMLALFFGAFIVFPIVILLLVPLWILFDAGIMSKTNPEKASLKRSPETVETIDKFYINKFKGFGGIAFTINFIAMIIQVILMNLAISLVLFSIFLPLLGIALTIPLHAVYEKVLPSITRKIHESSKLHESKLSLVKVDKCPACSRKLKK